MSNYGLLTLKVLYSEYMIWATDFYRNSVVFVPSSLRCCLTKDADMHLKRPRVFE